MHGCIYFRLGPVTELVQSKTGEGGQEFVKSLQFQYLNVVFFSFYVGTKFNTIS
jgi:hypothetical protein